MDKKALAALLQKAQAGDRKSLELLCRELEQIMCGYFKRKFSDPEVVNDLCQETYFRLLNSYKKIREPQKLRNFVVKISLHVSQDYFRQKYRHDDAEFKEEIDSENQIDPLASSPQTLPLVSDGVIDKIDLEQALGKLSEKARKILAMQNSGYKYAEIAKTLDISESAVKMQVKRSLEKLKTLLYNVTFWLS